MFLPKDWLTLRINVNMPYKNKEDHLQHCREYNKIWRNTERGKEVRKNASAKWYKNGGKEKVVDRHEKYSTTVHGRAILMWHYSKRNASKKDRPFTITQKFVKDHLSKLKCEVTGMPIDLASYGNKANPYAPSLDQKTPGDGYTPKNTQIVCWWYNRLKSNLTDKETKQLIKRIKEEACLKN